MIRYTAELEHAGGVRLVDTHAPGTCRGEYCTIHRRSDHHMRGWRQAWRGDLGGMERICPHGIGHPDPDELTTWPHACDGCCVSPGVAA